VIGTEGAGAYRLVVARQVQDTGTHAGLEEPRIKYDNEDEDDDAEQQALG
jgi:hypothetical protein